MDHHGYSPKVGLLNFGKGLHIQTTCSVNLLRFVSIKYPNLRSQTKGQINSVTPATVVKHRTTYYPPGYADIMNNQAVE